MATQGIYHTLVTQLNKLVHRRLRIHECFRLKAVAAKQCDRGAFFCGTGIGVMLAANKVKGAYAANVGNVYAAKRACLSNNCNIITIGCQTTGNMLAKELISAYLECEYVYEEKDRQQRVKEMLDSDYQDFGLVIAHEDGRPYEERQIAFLLRKLTDATGLPPVVFHSLRHCSASLKLQIGGGNIKAVQWDTGHAQSRTVTDLFAHTNNEECRRLAEKVGQITSGSELIRRRKSQWMMRRDWLTDCCRKTLILPN